MTISRSVGWRLYTEQKSALYQFRLVYFPFYLLLFVGRSDVNDIMVTVRVKHAFSGGNVTFTTQSGHSSYISCTMLFKDQLAFSSLKLFKICWGFFFKNKILLAKSATRKLSKNTFIMIFVPLNQMVKGILVFLGLFVCLFACLSVCLDI